VCEAGPDTAPGRAGVNPQGVIGKKRDGGELTDAELEYFVGGFLDEGVTDYQMAAWLMAVFLRGMTPGETATLTRLMVESGKTLSFPEVPGRKVDKHSTGGVGDLISLPLAPVVAAAGVPVPMISGRGLGHTGGTLDKLESISGLETGLDEDAFRRVLRDVGFVMGGQTEELAPADRRMYALRDVTATVESIPLIVSSILSKKVAEGIDALVLDVKCGRGAFMKTEEDAIRLAGELCRVGTLMGKEVVAFVTDMDAPLGSAVGNAVETRVAIDCLRGNGPEDTMELVGTLGRAMIVLGGRAASWDEAGTILDRALDSGDALARFRSMVEAQGGDASMVDEPDRLPRAGHEHAVSAPRDGFVTDIDPFALGEAVVELGGGRRRADDVIDPGVGVLLSKKPGREVKAGEALAVVLASDPGVGKRVAGDLNKAFTVGAAPPPPRPLVRHLVTADGSKPWAGAATWDGRGSGKPARTNP